MKTNEIRRHFLTFFESKGHKIVPSASMVVKNDPTLLFTNAGMNQFKDLFLGNSPIKDKRVADTQKCLRVSGKHNDLEEVGVDTYHHTMFEMLGNWSFGDYFKEDAIAWAWELLTKVFKIDTSRIYVTVFEGDDKDGVPMDTESIALWKKWIAEDRILACNKKDNFWEMGDTGPCGPCTEIHVDIRPEEDRKKVDGKTLVNNDHPQVIEIWNLVFMQFNRMANGSLVELPAKHVDTGMGLERLAMVLQGKTSNYDTDIFQQLIRHVEQQTNIPYGKSEVTDIAMRVIADHVRTIAFSIADGQLPSNNGAGYVIRRILRRAVRYGYQSLGLHTSFLADLSTVLADAMGEDFPELRLQLNIIQNVIREEENAFFKTLEQGIKRMNGLLEEGRANEKKVISGKAAFELYDTFGFPIDLSSLIARENGFSIDEAAFNDELKMQKERSRAATSLSSGDWVVLREDQAEEFVGYDSISTHVYITRYRNVVQNQKSFFQLVFNITPFYAESGGQVGDKGSIEANGEKTAIFDTKKENNLILHFSNTLPTDVNANFLATVHKAERHNTASNHSATHLLHYALRKVLGNHVEQKGSLVHPAYLRFDFSHFSKLSEGELTQVATIVKEKIKENIALNEYRNLPIEEAKEKGAMALFGEKYGDVVRVIQFGDSIELCGGTHVSSTGTIGLFKILSESSVAAGVRRIEAITGAAAEAYYHEIESKLQRIGERLKNTLHPERAVEELIDKNQALTASLQAFEKEQVKATKQALKSALKERNGVLMVSQEVQLSSTLIKDVLFQMKAEITVPFVAIIGGSEHEKVSLNVLISEDLVKEKSWHAGNLVKEFAPLIQGGGGGQPFYASAGGKDAKGLSKAIEAIQERLA